MNDLNTPFYVTMTDSFLSGWGGAEGKTCKYIYPCSNYREASIVADNAKGRGDQRYVNIRTSKPYYNSRTHLTKWASKENNASWYKEGTWR